MIENFFENACHSYVYNSIDKYSDVFVVDHLCALFFFFSSINSLLFRCVSHSQHSWNDSTENIIVIVVNFALVNTLTDIVTIVTVFLLCISWWYIPSSAHMNGDKNMSPLFLFFSFVRSSNVECQWLLVWNVKKAHCVFFIEFYRDEVKWKYLPLFLIIYVKNTLQKRNGEDKLRHFWNASTLV